MKTTVRKALVALALAGAAVGVGVNLASAQTDTTNPTTPPSSVAPQDPSETRDKENCPEKGGERGPRSGEGSATEGSNATRSARIRLT